MKHSGGDRPQHAVTGTATNGGGIGSAISTDLNGTGAGMENSGTVGSHGNNNGGSIHEH